MADRAKAGESVASGAFALHCRGDVRLYCGETDCTPTSKKGRALLAILAAEQRPLTRVKIIDLLWSDRQEEQARASLRTLLADLKEQFNSRFDELLVVERERIALGPAVRTDLTDPALARPVGELFEGLDHIDPELDEWLRVEREKWGKETAVPALGTVVAVRPRGLPQWALAALLILALIGGALLYFRPWASPQPPVIAVLKLKDSTGKNEALASGLSEQLRIELSQYPGISIIGRESSEAEQVSGKDTRTVARLLNATHVVEGTLTPHDGRSEVALRLIEGQTGRTIWNGTASASEADPLSEMSSIIPLLAEHVTDVSQRTVPNSGMRADAESYRKLFKARELAGFGSEPAKTEDARQLLFEVVSREPNFVPALVQLAHVTMWLSDHPSTRGPMPLAQARREAARYARRAIAIAPKYGPSYGALSHAYMEMDEALPLDRKAVELNPGNGRLRANLATSFTEAGDWQSALSEYQVAAKLDPLHAGLQWALAQTLANNGRLEEARRALDDYLARSVPEKLRLQMISSIGGILYPDDWSKIYVAARRAHKLDPKDPWTEGILFSVTLPLFGAEAARAYAGGPDAIPALVSSGDVAGLEQYIVSSGPEFWRLAGFTETAAHFLLRRGRPNALIAVYDRAREKGFRADDDVFVLEEVVVMLRQAGRIREANLLMLNRTRNLREEKAAPEVKAIGWAVHFALAGDTEKAIAHLRKAHAAHWYGLNNKVDHPFNDTAFDSIRADPRFRAMVADYDQLMARERRETLIELRRNGLEVPKVIQPMAARLS